MAKFQEQLSATANKAGQEWGAFSSFIRANPKTGFFVGIALGAVVGCFVVWVF